MLYFQKGDEVTFISKNKESRYYGQECIGRVMQRLSNVCMVVPYYSGHEELYYASDLRLVDRDSNRA